MKRPFSIAVVVFFAVSLLSLAGCASSQKRQMIVTAYSSDKISTNWKRGKILLWRKYVASGPNKGKRKKVGITSSGTKAKKGTIAADIRYYPYGTRMIIPGYGKGVVEDTGSAIKGPNRIDVYLGSRKKALRWGRKRLTVKIKRYSVVLPWKIRWLALLLVHWRKQRTSADYDHALATKQRPKPRPSKSQFYLLVLTRSRSSSSVSRRSVSGGLL